MRARATATFPFAIAIILPPAGLLLGVAAVSDGDREFGARLMVVAVVAAAIWTFLLVA